MGWHQRCPKRSECLGGEHRVTSRMSMLATGESGIQTVFVFHILPLVPSLSNWWWSPGSLTWEGFWGCLWKQYKEHCVMELSRWHHGSIHMFCNQKKFLAQLSATGLELFKSLLTPWCKSFNRIQFTNVICRLTWSNYADKWCVQDRDAAWQHVQKFS